MKAPNGKPTNLTERQWLQVRTKAFKEWFGDWEKNSKKNFLLKSSPVATLNGDEFSRVEGKSLTDQVEEYFKSIGNVAVSPFIGEVILDRDGADDSLAHGMGRSKAIAYAGVKDVIEKGVVVDTNENHRERGYNTMVVAAPISIGGNRHICTVVIKRNLTDNKFYLHEVTLQEKLLNEGSNTAQKQPQRPTAIANILKDIIVSSDNVSKVVDENGEPLVVYHATKANFSIFDSSFAGKGSGNTENTVGSFYFGKHKETVLDIFHTKTKEERDSYNVMEVFLSIKNPNNVPLEDFNKTWFAKEAYSQLKTGDGIIAYPKETPEQIYERKVAEYNRKKAEGKLSMFDRLPSSPAEFMEEQLDHIYVAFNPNQIKSATDNIGTFSGESDDIRYRKVRKVFNSDLSRGEVRAIQKYIESLDENTDTSNGLYFKKGNYLYKFNTSLRQYADNRRDGHDGFEIIEKYDISKLNKEQLKSIEDGIRNGKNIDSMLDKQGPWNEEGGLYDSDVIVDNRETAGNNDRLDNKTL